MAKDNSPHDRDPEAAAWAARFNMRLRARRPDIAANTLDALSADAWAAGALLSPVEVAELVAGAIDRRRGVRRTTPDRRRWQA